MNTTDVFTLCFFLNISKRHQCFVAKSLQNKLDLVQQVGDGKRVLFLRGYNENGAWLNKVIRWAGVHFRKLTQSWRFQSYRFQTASSAWLRDRYHGDILSETNLLTGRFSSTTPEFLLLLSWSLQTEGSGRHCFSCRASWCGSTDTLCLERIIRPGYPCQPYLLTPYPDPNPQQCYNLALTIRMLQACFQYRRPGGWLGPMAPWLLFMFQNYHECGLS